MAKASRKGSGRALLLTTLFTIVLVAVAVLAFPYLQEHLPAPILEAIANAVGGGETLQEPKVSPKVVVETPVDDEKDSTQEEECEVDMNGSCVSTEAEEEEEPVEAEEEAPVEEAAAEEQQEEEEQAAAEEQVEEAPVDTDEPVVAEEPPVEETVSEDVPEETVEETPVEPETPPEESISLAALQHAARTGDHALLSKHLPANPHFANEQDQNGWTLLHEAARGGHLDAVQLLVAHGSNLESTTKSGLTALALSNRDNGYEHPVSQFLIQQARGARES